MEILTGFIGQISFYLGELLTLFYQWTGSYAYSIILFAIAIKLSLFYLSAKQYSSMIAMQKLQPEMKRLQAKYKKEPEKLNEKMMELWKIHKVNPLSGCLPLLVQMPIIYALYRTIEHFRDKFVNSTFLWIGCMPEANIPHISYIPFLGKDIPLFGSNLSTPDLPLVLLYGLSMYLSQKLTMNSSPQGGQQKYTAVFMSVFITFIMFKFQSALILYWLVFNLLSIVQQQILMKANTTDDEAEIKVDLLENSTDEDDEGEIGQPELGGPDTPDKSRTGKRKKKKKKR